MIEYSENLIIPRAHGFPVEEHTIETSDGFLLAGWRLPRPGLPPVFLKHGWTCQSAIFFSGDGGHLDPSGSVIGGNNASIPFYLYATGKVDVWLVDDRQRPRPRHKTYGAYIYFHFGNYIPPKDFSHFIDLKLTAPCCALFSFPKQLLTIFVPGIGPMMT